MLDLTAVVLTLDQQSKRLRTTQGKQLGLMSSFVPHGSEPKLRASPKLQTKGSDFQTQLQAQNIQLRIAPFGAEFQ